MIRRFCHFLCVAACGWGFLPVIVFAEKDFLWGDTALAREVYEGSGAADADGAELSANEATRRTLLKQADQAWAVGDGIIGSADVAKKPNEVSPLEAKLNSIIVPKISFQGVSLRHAADMLANLAETLDTESDESKRGVNIVVLDEPSDETKIYLTLRQVSLAKIIQCMAQMIGYEYDIDEDAVILNSPSKNKDRLRTQFFPVSRATVVHLTNLRAKTTPNVAGDQEQIKREEELLRSFLQNAGVDFTPTSGTGLAFDGQRLIITQTPRNLRHIQQILNHYAQIKQVEIEAKFIEIQEGLLDELQFQWSVKNSKGTTSAGDSLRTLDQAFGPSDGAYGDGGISYDGKSAVTIPNQAPSLPSLANLGQNVSPLVEVLGVIKGAQIHTVVHALEQHSGSDLMSAPKVTVLSGKTAEIVVAQEMRYPEEYDEIQSSVGTGSSLGVSTSAGVTITAGTPRNFKTRNIGVEMTVTPFVEEDDKITLQLEPTVTEFERFVEYGGVSVAVAGGTTVTIPSGFFQPVFSTRKIRTELTIENGATVVMGGLTREEIKQTRDKVPLLGNLPVIGRLFRSHGTMSQKRNLLIFVTARLVNPQGDNGIEGEIISQPEKNRHRNR